MNRLKKENNIKRVEEDKNKIKYIEYKNVIFVLFFVLFILTVLFIARCNAYGKTQIELGMKYNSNSKREENTFNAFIEKRKNSLETEIVTEFYKEQKNKVLESLRIDAGLQTNYYLKDKYFLYLGTNYERDYEYGIEDKTSVDLGAGIKEPEGKYPYKIQTGLLSGSVYYNNNESDRDIFLKCAGNVSRNFGSIELRDDLMLKMNLESSKNTDFEIKNLTSAKAYLTEDFYISISLNFSFHNHPLSDYPKEIKTWILRGGINF